MRIRDEIRKTQVKRIYIIHRHGLKQELLQNKRQIYATLNKQADKFLEKKRIEKLVMYLELYSSYQKYVFIFPNLFELDNRDKPLEF